MLRRLIDVTTQSGRLPHIGEISLRTNSFGISRGFCDYMNGRFRRKLLLRFLLPNTLFVPLGLLHARLMSEPALR